MAHQSFKRARAKDPVSFDLWDAEDNPVTYHCVPSLPVGVILDFGALMGGEGQEKAPDGSVLGAVMNLFKSAIVPDQWDQFNAALHDPALEVDMEVLTSIAAWLTDQYTGDRPTGAPSEPGSDKISSGNSSMAGASAGISTYSRSEPIALST